MKERIVNIADKIVEYSLYGLIFFIPISNAAIEIFACLAIAAFITKKILKPDFEFLRSRENIFLSIFALLSVLSLFNSGVYIHKSLRALFSKWFELIMIFLVVQDTLNSRKRIRNVIIILLSIAGLLGIDGLVQKILGVEFLRLRDDNLLGITASFNHYNDFGTYLVCVLPIAICSIFSNVKIKIKLILAGLGILLATCLLFTFSRGAWLAFIGSFIAILILSRKFKVTVPIIFLFIIILIIFTPFRERTLFTFENTGDADRLLIWRVSATIMKENPFLGKGVNTFMDYFGQYYPRRNATYAHNCYLQMWAETGIFALLSFLIFLIILLKKSIRSFRANNDYLLLGLISAIFGFLIYSFFDTPLYSLQLSCLFWYLLGITKKLSSLDYIQSIKN